MAGPPSWCFGKCFLHDLCIPCKYLVAGVRMLLPVMSDTNPLPGPLQISATVELLVPSLLIAAPDLLKCGV